MIQIPLKVGHYRPASEPPFWIRACGSPKYRRGILELRPLIAARSQRLTNTLTRHISNREHYILPGLEVINIVHAQFN